MTKIKTSELTGPALDWAVARAAGLYAPEPWISDPSTDWAQGGPIIDRERIQFRSEQNTQYRAFIGLCGADATGPTHLIAAMRCYVASNLGDEVDVPEELL